MYEYYRQAQEIVPSGVRKVLDSLFTSKAYQIVNSRYVVYHIVISSHIHFLCILIITYEIIIPSGGMGQSLEEEGLLARLRNLRAQAA